MFSDNNNLVKNTSHKVVLPFYLYAAFAFLAATILLFLSTNALNQHYFNPKIMAITHIMALGWGTMMILGASHQLVPVIIEGKLFSNILAHFSFITAAIGIPLLAYGFYVFNMGWPAQWGAILINTAILSYLGNLTLSMIKRKKVNVHATFVLTAALWLFVTTLVGLLLVYNFSDPILPTDSLHYLSLHAHLGIIGWFLLLVIGVGSRLIPMFLISKYSNTKLLWLIFGLINAGLLTFIIFFLYVPQISFYLISFASILFGIGSFGYYCYHSFKQRIRKKVDEIMKISLLSVIMMFLPVILLFTIIVWLLINSINPQLVLVYGFVIFFGWITAIILGMTFKTLPFIVWNKVYHLQAGLGKTPNPKDMFSSKIFSLMSIAYLAGFILFLIGVYLANNLLLKLASFLLLLAALFYNWNVLKIFSHKSVKL
ncbi:MAG: hypothetical protein JJE07_01040 [Flavobacteriaceae bacterium]|nr:hypothetical protein [Flavobacteriaceae bacterium]